MSFSTFSYVTLSEANDYFSTRLKTDNWAEANNDKRTKALIEASRLINNLNFKGYKHSPTQVSLFPRLINCHYIANVPEQIQIACLEIAYALLDDALDMELEYAALSDLGTAYSSVRADKNQQIPDEHIRAGIPSASAWRYLLPYLIDPKVINIH